VADPAKKVHDRRATPETSASTPEAATPSRANLVILVFDTLPVATAALARQGALDLLSREFRPEP
jgi:hypothetical protein